MPDYTRTVLFENSQCEVVLISWPPGSRSAIHDHGTSEGAVIVLEGEVYEERRNEGRQYHAVLDVLEEHPATIHRMGNASAEPALTLHIYRPKLTMNFYDE